MVVSTLIRPGRSLGRKGRTVTGESTSLDMYRQCYKSERGEKSRQPHSKSTYTATLRLVAVNFSERPRDRRGTIRESVAESTSETNVVAERSWIVLGTSSTGLIND